MLLQTTDPVGARIDGVDLRTLDDGEIGELEALLAERGVVVLTEQTLDDDEFTHFLTRLGPLFFTAGETPVPGHPDLNVISNVGRSTAPRSTFHVDTSYVAAPPAYTALRAVSIPSEGGQTLFTNQYRAYETLDEDLRHHLADRTMTHVATGVELTEDDEDHATHPLLRKHPVSGRTALYLTTPARCAAVSGMDADEAEALVARLYTHSTSPENTYRHAWAAGDVVIWDNGCVLHRADHSGVVGDRVMHRGMSVGYAGRTADPRDVA